MNKLELLYFGAAWCGPCRVLKKMLKSAEINDILKNRNITLIEIDIEKESETTLHHVIDSVPTLILLKNGKEIGRLVGLPSLEKLILFLSSDSEEYNPYILEGPEVEDWGKYCDSLLPRAIDKALGFHWCKDSWCGWADIVEAMVKILQEQGYKLVIPTEKQTLAKSCWCK